MIILGHTGTSRLEAYAQVGFLIMHLEKWTLHPLIQILLHEIHVIEGCCWHGMFSPWNCIVLWDWLEQETVDPLWKSMKTMNTWLWKTIDYMIDIAWKQLLNGHINWPAHVWWQWWHNYSRISQETTEVRTKFLSESHVAWNMCQKERHQKKTGDAHSSHV